MMIDLTDCDVRLPSPYEILRSSNDSALGPDDRPTFRLQHRDAQAHHPVWSCDEDHLQPDWLDERHRRGDPELAARHRCMEGSSPSELVFQGADSRAPAGILHVGFACLMMLFFRVFMRISYIAPRIQVQSDHRADELADSVLDGGHLVGR